MKFKQACEPVISACVNWQKAGCSVQVVSWTKTSRKQSNWRSRLRRPNSSLFVHNNVFSRLYYCTFCFLYTNWERNEQKKKPWTFLCLWTTDVCYVSLTLKLVLSFRGICALLSLKEFVIEYFLEVYLAEN